MSSLLFRKLREKRCVRPPVWGLFSCRGSRHSAASHDLQMPYLGDLLYPCVLNMTHGRVSFNKRTISAAIHLHLLIFGWVRDSRNMVCVGFDVKKWSFKMSSISCVCLCIRDPYFTSLSSFFRRVIVDSRGSWDLTLQPTSVISDTLNTPTAAGLSLFSPLVTPPDPQLKNPLSVVDVMYVYA